MTRLEILQQKLAEAQKQYNESTTDDERNTIKILRSKHWKELTPDEQKIIAGDRKLFKPITKLRKKIKKENWWQEQLMRADDILNDISSTMNNTSKIFCMDLEMCENSGKLTEVGIAIWHRNKITCHHFIVEETEHLRNGNRVPDNKYKFKFGQSKKLKLCDITKEVTALISGSELIVGHAFSNDIFFLHSIGIINIPTIYDTQKFAPLYLKEKGQFSLSYLITNLLHEQPLCLHNGGNDAYYTLKTMLKIANIL